MDTSTDTPAHAHIRGCATCKAGHPCDEARERFYDGGLVYVTDPGRLPTIPGRAA